MNARPADSAPFSELGIGEARRLLSLCESGPGTPAEHLFERLRAEDGPAWARAALEAARPDEGPDGRSVLLTGAGGVEASLALKQRGKATMRRADGADGEGRAALLYLGGVVSALAHHDRMISTRRPDALLAHLDVFAELAPEEMRETIELAARKLRAHADEP